MVDERERILKVCADELYSAVVADTLDGFGHHEQVVATGLHAIEDGMRIFGFARTGIYMPIYHDDETVNVYEHEIRLIDDLKRGDVPVLACNGNLRIAPWGELLSTRARYLGASGCITDGSVRDVDRICQMGFPVFAGGRNPADTKFRGKMMWADVPARLGTVMVHPGDLVVADRDGMVVVPGAITADVIDKSLEKVRKETTVRGELERGATLVDVFERHGIL